jgi:hypothetical protein
MPGWVRGGARIAAGLGKEAEPWSIVVFEGVGVAARDGICVMAGLELVEGVGEKSGVLWEGR